LQTVYAVIARMPEPLISPRQHWVSLPDGDQLALHEDGPLTMRDGRAIDPNTPSALLIHGLCGCHAAGYMVRCARRLLGLGYRVFRLDMRGCGAGHQQARHITHAGRSEDIRAALRYIALQSTGPIDAIGFSMGGNQLLKALGELAAGHRDDLLVSRLRRAAAAAPPVQLSQCAANMERWILRPYNRYFIRRLLQNVPPQVADSRLFTELRRRGVPKTIRAFDDQFTAPLAGYAGAEDYYHRASSSPQLPLIEVPTLVLAARDDPLVPVQAIESAPWSRHHQLLITDHGGHIGYWADGPNRHWLDSVLTNWLATGAIDPTRSL
jgi:predicted alpha/beta-fold hydrolase